MKSLVTAAALALAVTSPVFADGETHYVAIHVDENDPQVMNMALNNVLNVTRYYEEHGDSVMVELVAYGPGLTMLLDERSPVQQRIEQMSLEMENVSFSACGNTHANWSRRDGFSLPLVAGAEITPSGVVRLIELQEEGYAYVRP
ncbi:DsrE family protein [Maritalea mobilis]|uniref:DsrE family protein n=1 Tax=Maritalea mobilis TaxID=483324 RepID=UPI001C956DCD|nr:DsrE family protein [Maritalea mobilis]MBY6202221.1 DsrE family protein [Maritalea mobilis]